MIYYLAHSYWILKRSRTDIVEKLNTDFKISSICPLSEGDIEKNKTYFEKINWEIDRTKLLDTNSLIKLRKILNSICDESIIHIFTIKSLYIFIISTIFLKKKFKVIVSITGLGFIFADSFLAKILKNLVRPIILLRINKIVQLIIFQNKSNMETFTKYSNYKNNLKIIEGSGLNISDFKTKNDNELKKIIFVGRLMREKGIYEYIEIAEKLQGRNDIDFFIAGSPDFGNKSSVSKEEFKIIQNNPNIKYLGEIDVNNRLHEFDILIQPSYHEGFSRILIEGIYVGLYCIANDIPGMNEIINKTKFGDLIHGNNIDDYIKSIEKLSDRIPYEKFINAREKIMMNYSVQAISNEFRKIYNEYT